MKEHEEFVDAVPHLPDQPDEPHAIPVPDTAPANPDTVMQIFLRPFMASQEQQHYQLWST